MKPEPFLPLVVIGAPRSGTNMLRDVLCRLPATGTWPCDEINYIWRHRNVRHPDDEFTAGMAVPAVRRYISRAFERIASRRRLGTVVEKTCANSLRVPFVDAVLPGARYVFIYRDGVDAVASAAKRWRAGLDLSYLLRKARFVPPGDIPYYAAGYLRNRIYRAVSGNERVAFWGPRFRGLPEALGRYSLREVCALQWKRCVDLADRALSEMPEGKVVRVRYEGFVEKPEDELGRILDELGLSATLPDIRSATAGVSAGSIGKGREAMSPVDIGDIRALAGETLARLGYE